MTVLHEFSICEQLHPHCLSGKRHDISQLNLSVSENCLCRDHDTHLWFWMSCSLFILRQAFCLIYWASRCFFTRVFCLKHSFVYSCCMQLPFSWMCSLVLGCSGQENCRSFFLLDGPSVPRSHGRIGDLVVACIHKAVDRFLANMKRSMCFAKR